jgi:signal transduction histidine kinase
VSVEAKVDATEVIVSISDTGVGMRKEIVDRLFRIDAKHSTKGTANEKGTGLGLILCKEFIEKNGGRIWVTSEEGKGSVFYFSLPG